MKPTSKKGRLVRNLAIHVKLGMAATSSRLFKGSPAFTRWNFVRVLALGVLMSAGAAIYFNLASEGVADAPSTVQNVEATSSDDSARYLHRLNNDDEWTFGPPYLEDFQSESATQTARDSREAYTGDDEWVFGPPYIQVFPEDDPYAYLTLEPFDQAATTKDAPNYHQ